MRKSIFLLAFVFLTASLLGCSTNISKLDQEETYPAGPSMIAVKYQKFDSLYEKSQDIVEGQVIDTKTMLIDGMSGTVIELDETMEDFRNYIPVTISTIKVINVFKGELSPEKEIQVVEDGGIVKGQQIYIDVPPLKKEQHMVLFLMPNDGPILPECYALVGGFQGKFIEKQGYIIQQGTVETKLKDYEPLTLKDFSSKLNSKKSSENK